MITLETQSNQSPPILSSIHQELDFLLQNIEKINTNQKYRSKLKKADISLISQKLAEIHSKWNGVVSKSENSYENQSKTLENKIKINNWYENAISDESDQILEIPDVNISELLKSEDFFNVFEIDDIKNLLLIYPLKCDDATFLFDKLSLMQHENLECLLPLLQVEKSDNLFSYIHILERIQGIPLISDFLALLHKKNSYVIPDELPNDKKSTQTTILNPYGEDAIQKILSEFLHTNFHKEFELINNYDVSKACHNNAWIAFLSYCMRQRFVEELPTITTHNEGRTMLMLAIEKDDYIIFRIILHVMRQQQEYFTSYINATDNDGYTALFFAIYFERFIMVYDLIQIPELNLTISPPGMPVIHQAILSIKDEFLANEYLNKLKRYCLIVGRDRGKQHFLDAIQERDDYARSTPLHRAILNENPIFIKLLLESEVDINPLDIEKHTPLHYAAERKDVETVKTLLQKGANVNIGNKDDLNKFAASKAEIQQLINKYRDTELSM